MRQVALTGYGVGRSGDELRTSSQHGSASESRPNSVNTAYTFHDTASRPDRRQRHRVQPDANGNRTQMTDWEGMTTYSHDALDRLIQATYPTSTVTYTLDSVGNRLSDGMVSFRL